MTSFNATESLPGIILRINSSGSTQPERFCVNRERPEFLIFCFLPASALFVNVLIFVAVFRERKRLLQESHVYVNVYSTLSANVLFSVLGLIEILGLYFHFGGLHHDPNPGKRSLVQEGGRWVWALRKSILCAVYVIMCGNIGLLIDGIRHRTCSVQRATAGRGSFSEKQGAKWRKTRRFLMMVALWIVPLLYVIIPVVTGWNCSHVCQCLSECFLANHSHTISDRQCSRSIPPMLNYWLVGVVATWTCCLLTTMVMLCRSCKQLQKFVYLREEKSVQRMPLSTSNEKTGRDEPPHSCCNGGCVSFSISALPGKSPSSRSVAFAMRYVFYLTILFAILTAPTMIIIVVDMLQPQLAWNMAILNICLLSPFVYCCACPFILVKCLPGVRTSCLWLTLCSACTTVTANTAASNL